MTSRRDFTRIISLGTMGTLFLGAASCNGNKEKQGGPVVWPSNKLNLAFVGIHGRGSRNINALKEQNVVALCDVDWGKQSQPVFDAFPKANRYKDFRVMLEKEKNLDGVVISTPDHSHGVIAMMTIKTGNNIYLEKPLAHSIYETRQITKAAREYGVQSQMGNQGHSTDSIREFYEYVKAGTIGKVTEVHAWCNRPAGGGGVSFPHGISRPEGKYKVPKELDWDLWLGPAEYRPYHPAYLPRSWRGFIDFGSGALGDFGCHTLDPAFWALDLGSPESVICSTSNLIEEKDYDTFATASITTFHYPERNEQPPVKVIWYDGGLLPLHDERFRDIKFSSTGALLVGEKGIISHDSHGAAGYKIHLSDKNAKPETPPQLLKRTDGHYADWVKAIKTGESASGNFDYGGPLTETVMLGVAAALYRNRYLEWDSENMRFSNFDDPDNRINPVFREGWSL